MRPWRAVLWPALLLAAPAMGWEVTLPSGAGVAFHDAIWEEDSGTLRLRYVVPAVADPAFADRDADIHADMEWLCRTQALVMIGVSGHAWEGVTITMMAQPVVFGDTAPDVVQFFEAFVLQDGLCVWDAF